MANKKNGSPSFAEIFHFAEAFRLKLRIAYGKHFIDHQDFGFQVRTYIPLL